MVLNTTLFKNTYEEEDGILTNTLSGRYENNRIVTLGSLALYNQQHITELILPHAKNINQYACANLSNCSHIELNWSEITTINQYAFRSCSLWADNISCGATTVQSYAFLGCIGLTELNFPSATTVGQYAFSTCNNVSYANLPNVTSLNQYAFVNCTKLENVNIPKVALISTSTFAGCTNLKMLYLPSGHTIAGYGCLNCRQLSTVIFGANTAGFISGTGPFSGCWRLMSLYLLGSVLKPLQFVNAFTSTPISTYTTYTDGQRGSIFVPSSLYSSYIVAAQWSTYSARFVSMTDQEIEDFLSSVIGIEVKFNQGDNIIYSTDTLDSLKQYLTVTAQLISGPQVVPNANYTLSGSLSAGICTITVSYSGKTTTFDVRVRLSQLPTIYTEVEYILSNGGAYAGDITISVSSGSQIEAYTAFKYLGSATNNFWVAGDGSSKDGYQLEFGYYSNQWYPINTLIDSMDGDSFPNAKYGSRIIRTYTTSVSLSYRVCQRSGFGAQSDARRIYDTFFKVNNDMVFELIPCYRNSDNVCGFYDIVTDTFYLNAGSGEFTYEAL